MIHGREIPTILESRAQESGLYMNRLGTSRSHKTIAYLDEYNVIYRTYLSRLIESLLNKSVGEMFLASEVIVT